MLKGSKKLSQLKPQGLFKDIQVFLREPDIKELMDRGLKLPEIIQAFLKMGYKGIQLAEGITRTLGRYYTQKEIDYIHKLSKKIPISFHCHNRGMPSLVLEQDLEKAKRSIDRAVALGADYIVFHFGEIELSGGEKLEEKFDVLAKNINDLIEYGARKILVSIENVRRDYSDINGFKAIRERLQAAGKELKITFDTGHAFVDGMLQAKVKNGPESAFRAAKEYVSSFINALGQNIHNTHLHDNTFLRSEQHMIIGDGRGPVEFTLKKLLKTGYQGNLLCEIHLEKWRDKLYKGKDALEIYQIALHRLRKMLENLS